MEISVVVVPVNEIGQALVQQDESTGEWCLPSVNVGDSSVMDAVRDALYGIVQMRTDEPIWPPTIFEEGDGLTLVFRCQAQDPTIDLQDRGNRQWLHPWDVFAICGELAGAMVQSTEAVILGGARCRDDSPR